MESYGISSKTGMRHVVAGPMPSNDAALAMWRGRDLPTTLCGRVLEPVNFYETGEKSLPRYTCTPCAEKVPQKT